MGREVTHQNEGCDMGTFWVLAGEIRLLWQRQRTAEGREWTAVFFELEIT